MGPEYKCVNVFLYPDCVFVSVSIAFCVRYVAVCILSVCAQFSDWGLDDIQGSLLWFWVWLLPEAPVCFFCPVLPPHCAAD